MELEQIVELIDRVSASELDSFCLEQNGMQFKPEKKKQPRKQTDPETQSTLVQLQKQVGKSTRTVQQTDVIGGAYRNRAHKNRSIQKR